MLFENSKFGFRLLIVRENSRKVPLYSISSHPLDLNEFCVGGRDQYVRFYDKRNTKQIKKKFRPQHMVLLKRIVFDLNSNLALSRKENPTTAK